MDVMLNGTIVGARLLFCNFADATHPYAMRVLYN